MRTANRPYSHLRAARTILAVLAVVAVAYRGTRAAGSLLDTWTLAAAVLLAGAAFTAGARVHIVKAHDRADAAQREAEALRQNLETLRQSSVRPGRVHADLELMGVDPEAAAAARRIHERLLNASRPR